MSSNLSYWVNITVTPNQYKPRVNKWHRLWLNTSVLNCQCLTIQQLLNIESMCLNVKNNSMFEICNVCRKSSGHACHNDTKHRAKSGFLILTVMVGRMAMVMIFGLMVRRMVTVVIERYIHISTWEPNWLRHLEVPSLSHRVLQRHSDTSF